MSEIVLGNPKSIPNPDIAYIASRAAFELEKARLNVKLDFQYVHLLAKLFDDAFKYGRANPEGETEVSYSLFDPISMPLLSEAIGQTYSTQPTSIRDLATEALRIAQNLEENPLTDTERLRDFCLALSSVAEERYEPVDSEESASEPCEL
ncbi:MAG: hypothetical protein HYV27_23340 [Candidatus Hydrogenedentes bacterium]|nr:hypothetical protein [Candidatus Hydrogenedentota bacterium]